MTGNCNAHMCVQPYRQSCIIPSNIDTCVVELLLYAPAYAVEKNIEHVAV